MVFSSFLFQNRRFEFWTTIFPLYHAVAVFYLCKFNYFICYFASFDDFWFFVGFFVVFLSRLRKMWSMMLDVRTHKIAIDFNNFYFSINVVIFCSFSSIQLVFKIILYLCVININIKKIKKIKKKEIIVFCWYKWKDMDFSLLLII